MTKKEALKIVAKFRGNDILSTYMDAIEINGLGPGRDLPHGPVGTGTYREMHADVIESLAYSYNGDIA